MNGDNRLESAIGRVLRLGIVTSSACLAVGLALTLVTESSRLSQVLLTTGVIILMATPVGRVVVSLAEYAMERDWLFVVFTSIVLLELVGSVVVAFR